MCDVDYNIIMQLRKHYEQGFAPNMLKHFDKKNYLIDNYSMK